jgi:hypothetical protein
MQSVHEFGVRLSLVQDCSKPQMSRNPSKKFFIRVRPSTVNACQVPVAPLHMVTQLLQKQILVFGTQCAKVDQRDRIAMFKSNLDGLASISVDLASAGEPYQTLVSLLALDDVVMDGLFDFWFLLLDCPKFKLNLFLL